MALATGLCQAQSNPIRPFSGVVSDTLGNLIQNVELLIVDTRLSTEPIASTRSDDRGQFHFSEFRRGVYRIAALKDGYLTFVGKVNTETQNWIQVILHPSEERVGGRLEHLPRDSSWVYRLPRRYVLHDEDPTPLDAEPRVRRTNTPRAARDPLRMQVDQLFSTTSGVGSSDATRTQVRGSETQLKLASAVGEKGSIDVRGFHRRFGVSRPDGTDTSVAGREAVSLAAAFSYDTSAVASLAVNTFFDQQQLEYSIGRAPADPAVPADSGFDRNEQGYRHWGYDATWSRQLDDTSSLKLKLDFLDTFMGGHTAPTAGAAPAPGALAGSVSTRTVGASGVYAHEPIEDHRVQIDFRAQRLDASNPGSRTDERLATPLDLALAGWSVGVNAQDTWSVSRPLSVIYGLGYRYAIGPRRGALIVPRVGADWSVKGLAVRATLAYHRVADRSSGESVDLVRPFRPARALGYEIEIDVPVGAGVSVSGASSFSPIQLAVLGYARGGFSENARAIFLTDGNTAVSETRLALVQRSARTRTYFEYSSGVAEGNLAAITLNDVRTDFLTARTLDYGTGRVGVQILTSGTDVLVEYQRMHSTPTGVAPGGDSHEESIELRITQQLLYGLPVGDWRLLVAVRRASLKSAAWDGLLTAEGAEVLDSLNHQLSAGLSVSF